MPAHTLRLYTPPAGDLSLRVQALPCEGQTWWRDIDAGPIACTEGSAICNVTVQRPDEWPEMWVRGFFRWDAEADGVAFVDQSAVSNTISSPRCAQDAPPVPVPEPGVATAMIWGVAAVALVAFILAKFDGGE